MLEKVSQVAEQVATRLARRAFLGKVGQSALALAGVLGGLLALPGEAQAIGRGAWYCCYDDSGTAVCQAKKSGVLSAGNQSGPMYAEQKQTVVLLMDQTSPQQRPVRFCGQATSVTGPAGPGASARPGSALSSFSPIW